MMTAALVARKPMTWRFPYFDLASGLFVPQLVTWVIADSARSGGRWQRCAPPRRERRRRRGACRTQIDDHTPRRAVGHLDGLNSLPQAKRDVAVTHLVDQLFHDLAV